VIDPVKSRVEERKPTTTHYKLPAKEVHKLKMNENNKNHAINTMASFKFM
jgi:N-formylglutamate amidohydrolase